MTPLAVAVQDDSGNRDLMAARTHRRAGVALFDEVRGRVFAVCGEAIEDAREFAVGVPVVKRCPGLSVTQCRRLQRAQIQDRAAQTALLVVDLHAGHPFDCLLVAGPSPVTAVWLWQYLPVDLRLLFSDVLKLPVGAGENAILAAALPILDMLEINSVASLPRYAKGSSADVCGIPGTAAKLSSLVDVRAAAKR